MAARGADAGTSSELQRLMYAATVPSRCTASELADHLKDDCTKQRWLVVDVRDDDYIGGNIVGAVRRSVNLFEDDDDVDEFVQKVLSYQPVPERVIFHCMLSQQRGPFSARRFLARIGVALAEEEEKTQDSELQGEGRGQGGRKTTSSVAAAGSSLGHDDAKIQVGKPEVSILNGGFSRFQSLFSGDPQMVENYEAHYHRQW